MVWILLNGLPLGESSDHTFQPLWIISPDRYGWRKSSLETGLSPATGIAKEFSGHMAIPQLNTIFFLTGTWQGALAPDKLPQSSLWQAATTLHQPELGSNSPKAFAVWREGCGGEAPWASLQDAAPRASTHQCSASGSFVTRQRKAEIKFILGLKCKAENSYQN